MKLTLGVAVGRLARAEPTKEPMLPAPRMSMQKKKELVKPCRSLYENSMISVLEIVLTDLWYAHGDCSSL